MRAVLSVSDKSGLVDFARGLAMRGVQLVSTGGTSKAIADAGLPVTNVSDVTGFPEMMDGRVKTLHPAIHGGILARRHRPDDLAAIRAKGIDLTDLVVVNLYPFAKAASNPETLFDELVEQIDIGGPSLLRAAGKNFRDVMVVVDPADYSGVLVQLSRPDGPTLEFKFYLMRKAFEHTAQFDRLIADTLWAVDILNSEFKRNPVEQALRYGENPHQKATWRLDPRISWKQHQGKELSYTNLLDLDAAIQLALEFIGNDPYACVIKHTNPCGGCLTWSIAGAYIFARDVDPLSAFGGIVGLNRPLDAETATAIISTFVECVVAPDVSAEALRVMATKPNIRVVTADFGTLHQLLSTKQYVQHLLIGTLSEQRDIVVEADRSWPYDATPEDLHAPPRVVTHRHPNAWEYAALRFAWKNCAHVKSNTIIFTTDNRILAVGAGQMSRVDSVNVAVMKAANRMVGDDNIATSLIGSVVASDAFFPFRDGLDAVANAGATAVVQPGGSQRDDEVIAAANERNIAMVFTGRRHFRH